MEYLLYLNADILFFCRGATCISTSTIRKSESQINNDIALLNPEEVEHKKKLQNYITVEGTVSSVVTEFDSINSCKLMILD